MVCLLLQVCNATITAARAGSKLHGLGHVVDPSNELIEGRLAFDGITSSASLASLELGYKRFMPYPLNCPLIPCFIDANTHLFPTNSRTADSLVQRPPIPRRIVETAADSTRCISGCGSTDGANPGRYLSKGRRLSSGIERVRQGKGQRRQRNAAGRRPPESTQGNKTVFPRVSYDITYDITYICDIIL